MAASSEPKGVFKQDMVVSTRYRNDLPPPPMPPKLLNIDTGGIEQYLTPGFAAAVARREEPNIEVDAEGGMPIDMIGIPGYFVGDESAIMAPDTLPQLDPADAALLLTPDQLRNPGAKSTNVSFLRRTQYISSGAGAALSPFRMPPTKTKGTKVAPSAKELQAQREEPMYIKRYIQKGFDVAYPEDKHTGPETESKIKGLAASPQEVEEWQKPVHPDNPRLKPLEVFPVMPDLEAFTDAPGYASFKFDKAPLPAVGGRRDARIDVALLHPTNPSRRVQQEHEARLEAHRVNPALHPHPGEVPLDWDVCLPETAEEIPKIKATLNAARSHKDDDKLYTEEDDETKAKFFRFPRLRSYETAHQVLEENTLRSVALSLFDPETAGESSHLAKGPKAAYYYPISQKTKLRPERSRTLAQGGFGLPRPQEIPEGRIDQIKLTVREPDEEEIRLREENRIQVDSRLRESIQDAEGDVEMGEGEEVTVSQENGDHSN